MVDFPRVRCRGCGEEFYASTIADYSMGRTQYNSAVCPSCHSRNNISLYDLKVMEEEERERRLSSLRSRESITTTYVRTKPLPPYGTPERMKIERDLAKNLSLSEMADRVEEWIAYERELKERSIMAETKHRTLRKLFFGLRGFAEGFMSGASNMKALERNRCLSLARELSDAGVLIYTMTLDELPENERRIAKRIISKYI